ncbi:MAG: RdgB/HAM1 family non-canonical purine NTP pyrophosphatase [Oscillospiraceae bacterium]|nr:RdgB/HAM1 family non-canonical purine NTP pyrophosphatase [Oscillospiraceae bacterium]
MEAKEFLIATNNPGKVREFRRILEPMGFTVYSLKELGLRADVEETGTTFRENAFLKASAMSKMAGMPAIADDSGLCVDALGGDPGVYSARYGGEGLSDQERTALLLRNMEGVSQPQRGARFVSAICCVFPNGDRIETEGVCEGSIGYEEKGENGFGYDPVFQTPFGSFAEISDEKKDELSHRGKALRLFGRELEAYRASQRDK